MRRRCLELIASRPAGVDRDELELDTLRAMAPPLNALHGYASRELQSALQRAEHLAGALGRRETQLVCLVGLFASSFVQGATAESQRSGPRPRAGAVPRRTSRGRRTSRTGAPPPASAG